MDKYDKLRELKSLFDSGLLTEFEFSNLKNEILFDDSKVENIKSENKGFNNDVVISNKTTNNVETPFSPKTESRSGINIIIIIVAAVSIIFGIKWAKNNSNRIDNTRQETNLPTVSKSNDNSNNQEVSNSQPEPKKCFECRGTGMITCKMCNGTGTNDMGMDCGCLSYNLQMIQLGKETDPYSGPVHPCRACRGTGIDAPRKPEPMFNNN
jgi:hypothetical protein